MSNSEEERKILFFAPVPPPFNGATYATSLLLESEFSREFKVDHLDCRFSVSNSDYSKFSIIKIFIFLKYLFQLLLKLFKTNYNYVVICPAFYPKPFIKDSIYILIISLIFRKKIIIWAHGSGLNRLREKSPIYFRRYISFVISKVHCAIAVGEKLSLDFKGILTDNRISYIHYGVPELKLKINRYNGIGPVKVLYLSNMFIDKGWKLVFDAANEICEKQSNIVFDFYGSGGELTEDQLKKLFLQSPYRERIKYHGPIYGEKKNEKLSDADIFCFPTSYPIEAFPLVNLEAMQAGLPIITTAQGAISEAVENGNGGIIIRGQDKNELVNAILDLSEDSEKRKRMGEYNRERFLNYFTEKKFAERWISLINRLSEVKR